MVGLKAAFVWRMYEEALEQPRGSIARERDLMLSALLSVFPVVNNVVVLWMD